MYARGVSSGNSSRDIEGGGGGGGGRYNDTNAGILEQQNNERIYELSEQVSRLKVRVGVGVVSCRVHSSLLGFFKQNKMKHTTKICVHDQTCVCIILFMCFGLLRENYHGPERAAATTKLSPFFKINKKRNVHGGVVQEEPSFSGW